MKKSSHYLLVHRITRKPLPMPLAPFTSQTAAAVFVLEHDLRADVIPATRDLFGQVVPEDPEEDFPDRSLPLG